MNILLLTDGIYPFQLGGMQKYALVLARLLIQSDIQLHILHCGGEAYSKEKFNGLFAGYSVQETVIPFPKTDPFPGHYIRENKVYSKNAYLQLENQMDEFDIVYAQGFTGWRFIKEKNKKQFKAPVLVNFHGFEMFQTAPSLKVMAAYSLFKNSVKWNVRNADFVYSFGGKISKIIESLGVNKDEILLQSNGVEEHWINTTEIKESSLPRKFIFIGRAERRKGIEELNQALSHLILDKEKPFRFDFVGPISASLQLTDERITYHGEVRDTERIKSLLRQNDCLVCPSHAEGMPTVILEGMASGLAIIATNVGAVERQLKSNGILLDKPNVQLIKDAIEDVISCDQKQLDTWKVNSINLVKNHFTWERVVTSKIEGFNHAIAKNAMKSSDV